MQHKDWSAWRSLMPMSTPSFHVSGHVQVANPGITANLSAAVQAQPKPGVLALLLRTEQKPGMWPQVLRWQECTYASEMPREMMASFQRVEILHDGALLTTIEITDAH